MVEMGPTPRDTVVEEGEEDLTWTLGVLGALESMRFFFMPRKSWNIGFTS